MSDLIIYIALSLSILILVLLGLTLYQGKKRSEKSDDDGDERVRRARPVPVPVRDDGPRRRQRHRVVQRNEPQQMAFEAPRFDDDDEENDDGADDLGDEIDLPDGKIGAKKRKKLEMKAEKRAQRERDVQEREERKERDKKAEEIRRKEEERIKDEQLKKEEEERKAREEKERQEHEEYIKLKESFAIESEGFEENYDETETTNQLQSFIDYIKSQKVVLMEDLAGHFRMKTQDVITRVQELLAQELIVGVIDDRGKFIYITREELESVAKFIRQRGRVSITELVECSNQLINLKPENVSESVS